MSKRLLMMAALAAVAIPAELCADSIWDRRSPQMANLFNDYRARNVGDILTIVVDENTGLDNQEKRELEKATSAGMTLNGKGSSSSLGEVLRAFGYDLDLQAASKRKLDGKANSTINRNFSDRMSVVVVAVMPNGNIVIEGYRQRALTREIRTLRVMGIVRPADIGPFNTVQSQYIANVVVSYEGRGPESSYTNNGWGGRVFNKLWPF